MSCLMVKKMSNLYDNILYLSRGSPMTELSVQGDKLCLYTQNEQVRRRFLEWKQLLFSAPYTQENFFSGKVSLIATDLYFPRAAEKALVRALKRGGSFS